MLSKQKKPFHKIFWGPWAWKKILKCLEIFCTPAQNIDAQSHNININNLPIPALVYFPKNSIFPNKITKNHLILKEIVYFLPQQDFVVSKNG